MSLQLVVLCMQEALLPLYQLSYLTYKRSLLSSLTCVGTVVDSCTYICGSVSKEPKLLYKMASKYIFKKSSAFSTIRKMQIKITLRFHLTPDVIRKSEISKCWRGGCMENPYSLLVGCKFLQPLWKFK